MIEFEYIKPKFSDIKYISIYSLILSVLFTITFVRFSKENEIILNVLFSFFIFIFLLLLSRIMFMKIIAYKNGFEIEIRQTYFDRYGIRLYDKISYYNRNVWHNHHYKGIPTTAISIFIYIFTLGTIIFPSMWSYNYKKLEHMHIGTHQVGEYDMPHMYNIGVSEYRKSKAIFAGFLFYFIAAIFLKVFFNLIGETFFNWFSFILFWIAFVTILPIPGTEGYEFWRKNNFAWIMAITILILGMLSVIIFNSILYVIVVAALSSTVLVFVAYWKKIMGGGHNGH